MKQHVLESAKAYTALAVGIATALLGIYGPDTKVGQVLTVIVAVGGAIAVWTVPNADAILGKAFAAPLEDPIRDPHRPLMSGQVFEITVSAVGEVRDAEGNLVNSEPIETTMRVTQEELTALGLTEGTTSWP